MSVYQAVQGVQAVQALASGTAIQAIPSNLNFSQGLQQNIQIAMAPVLNNPLDGVVVDQPTETTDQQQVNVNMVPDATQAVEVASVSKPEETIETIESIVS